MSNPELCIIEANTSSRQRFSVGMRFYSEWSHKSGKVAAVRNNRYEREQRAKDPTHWWYHVDYDDGSFETMLAQSAMSHTSR